MCVVRVMRSLWFFVKYSWLTPTHSTSSGFNWAELHLVIASMLETLLTSLAWEILKCFWHPSLPPIIVLACSTSYIWQKITNSSLHVLHTYQLFNSSLNAVGNFVVLVTQVRKMATSYFIISWSKELFQCLAGELVQLVCRHLAITRSLQIAPLNNKLWHVVHVCSKLSLSLERVN